ncbi:uncharacterized protein LOC135494548 isoform X2 [Lineus longissimus]|uniref:uncharacterized protein LOC135494548 isoform X2 n=1 Tax=Lineus longissimus TaxID=88925 RepID=UPI00315D8159
MDKVFLDHLREGMRIDGQDDQGESILDFQELLSSSRADHHQVLRKIAKLDVGCENLSHDFDAKAVQLVNSKENADQDIVTMTNQLIDEDNNNVVLGYTKNIHLMKGAWAYVLRLDECMRVHLRNAANYHQFFYEIEEYVRSMDHCLPKLISIVESERPDAKLEDGQKLLQRTKNVVFAIYFFQGKVMEVYERSRTILPVYKRTDSSADGIPVMALCAYKNKQIEFKQGDDLSLLKNKDIQLWTVKNATGQTGDVPSPIVLIPGPDIKALNEAFELQVKLLGHWVSAVKILGKYILLYLVKMFSYWKEQKNDVLKCLPSSQKEEIKRLVGNAKETFLSIWAKCPGYTRMQDDGVYVTKLFLEVGDGRIAADDAQVTEIAEITRTMNDLVTTYRELLDKWRRFAMMVQMGKMPEQLLMVKGWEDYQLVNFDDLMEKWQKYMLDGDSSWWDEFSEWMKEWEEYLRLGGGDAEEELVMQTVSTVEAVAPGVTVGVSEETETAESEAVTRSESETQTKMVIIGAVDPSSGDHLNFEIAVGKGIINMEKGEYCNTKTGETKPLGQAMAEGQVLVEIQNVQKSVEKTTSYGIITIKTSKETRPYKILNVVNTDTDAKMSVPDAEKAGILNISKQTFRDKEENETMSIADAIEVGLIEVEYEQMDDVPEPEMKIQTYAVHGVIDRKRNRKISYNEAVSHGIVDPDESLYFDSITKEKLFLGDAITKGFIKARKVDNDADHKNLHF